MRCIAAGLVDGMRSRQPNALITERHLDPGTMPPVTGEYLPAPMVAAAERAAVERWARARGGKRVSPEDAASGCAKPGIG